MTATDRLNAMQQRCDAATEGPWDFEHHDEEILVLAGTARSCWTETPDGHRIGRPASRWITTDRIIEYLVDADDDDDPDRETYAANAEFIAAARADLPAAIAALRAVLKVHAPLWTPSRGHYCQECGTPLTDDAPDCPTVRAITEALT